MPTVHVTLQCNHHHNGLMACFAGWEDHIAARSMGATDVSGINFVLDHVNVKRELGFTVKVSIFQLIPNCVCVLN